MKRLLTTRRRSAAVALSVALALMMTSALSLWGCSGVRSERIEIAADYVRCSVDADYDAMSKVVAEEARPYCYALAAAPQPDAPLAEIVDETWEEGSLVLEISWGPTSSFMRLSPPRNDAPDEVIVETWNEEGARSDGTLTVSAEEDRLVITHIDGHPIEEVLAVGSGGL